MVIRLACFMLSSGWALLSAGAYYGLHYRSSAEVEATPGLNAAILGVSTFVVTQFVLTFVGGILLSVLDAGGWVPCAWVGMGLVRQWGSAGVAPAGFVSDSRFKTFHMLLLSTQRHPPPAWLAMCPLPPPTGPCSPAVFICWAIDRDSQTVSHPEVYAVLQTVPLPGAVVEQPDGGIAYGAGQQQQRGDGGHNYQPPGVTHL